MKVIILFSLFFCSGYLIIFIIDTFRGKSSAYLKYKNKKILKSIDEKMGSNQQLTTDEIEYILEQKSKIDLMNHLNKHRK